MAREGKHRIDFYVDDEEIKLIDKAVANGNFANRSQYARHKLLGRRKTASALTNEAGCPPHPKECLERLGYATRCTKCGQIVR